MSSLREISNELGHVVERALPRLATVHSGRCESAAAFVWSEGRIVTTASALGREEHVEVSLGGTRVPGRLLGADGASDLALVGFDGGEPLQKLELAGPLRLGELVLALGRAPSVLARLGIVSRVGGEWRFGPARFERYVESDIPPATALSGGPLLDASGALVGINSAGIARGRLVALPAESIARIVDAIAAFGRVRRARLGVSVQRVEVPAGLAREAGQRFGLIVLGVQPKSPAEGAGIGLGDVLLKLGQRTLQTVEDLQGALEEDAIDAETLLQLSRAGQPVSVPVTPRASG